MNQAQQKMIYAIASATGGRITKKRLLDEVKKLNKDSELPSSYLHLPFRTVTYDSFIFIEKSLDSIITLMREKDFLNCEIYLSGLSYCEENSENVNSKVIFTVKNQYFVGLLSDDDSRAFYPSIILPINGSNIYQFIPLKDYFGGLDLSIEEVEY